jgi:hypothetical protein
MCHYVETQPPIQWTLEVNRLELEADHLPLAVAEVTSV